MTDYSEGEPSTRFQWTVGKVLLIEVFVLLFAIIALVPVAFMGIALSAAKESDVPWWFRLYFGDIILIALSVVALPVTGLIAFILRLARD